MTLFMPFTLPESYVYRDNIIYLPGLLWESNRNTCENALQVVKLYTDGTWLIIVGFKIFQCDDGSKAICIIDYMRNSTLYYKISFVLNDFAQL